MAGRTYADVVNKGSGSHVSPSLLLMPGDGDCMFHAIAHGVGGGRFDAQTLRFAVVGYERANRAEFEPFIEGDFERHLNPRPAGPLDFPPPAGGGRNAPPHDLGSWSP